MTVPEILRWADEYHNRHGTWPDSTSGPIPEAPGETWKRVNVALLRGGRGLPRGATLKRLLWEQRGVQYAGRAFHSPWKASWPGPTRITRGPESGLTANPDRSRNARVPPGGLWKPP